MILFSKIRWKNLLSTGNLFTEIDLSSKGTTLIIGDNGAGKCVRRPTEIDIFFEDPEIQKKYEEFVKKRR